MSPNIFIAVIIILLCAMLAAVTKMLGACTIQGLVYYLIFLQLVLQQHCETGCKKNSPHVTAPLLYQME